jgi:hypothetical protein
MLRARRRKMTAETIQSLIKSALTEFFPDKKKANVAIWGLSKQILTAVNKDAKEKAKHLAEIEKTKKTEEKSTSVSDKMQEMMDNPMSEEEESKALRALLHVGLSEGALSPQLLASLDKIIGVSSGKDEAIEIVDFKDAFPSYAKAIEWCGRPEPKLCDNCGGEIK